MLWIRSDFSDPDSTLETIPDPTSQNFLAPISSGFAIQPTARCQTTQDFSACVNQGGIPDLTFYARKKLHLNIDRNMNNTLNYEV
jgi:hypothetical protein